MTSLLSSLGRAWKSCVTNSEEDQKRIINYCKDVRLLSKTGVLNDGVIFIQVLVTEPECSELNEFIKSL